jgi:hypothetical protein
MGFFGNKSHPRGLQRSQEKILFSIDHRVNRRWGHDLINAAWLADEVIE